MKVIVGLGNPGSRYDRTRHNAGFMVVDRLIARHASGETMRSRFGAGVIEARFAGEKCLLVKPITYMNRSGSPVAEAVNFYKLDPAGDLLVITDDVALAPGSIRMRASGGTGGHNGLGDIERALGTNAYPRLRVGIGAKPGFMDQADWVLSRFQEMEMGVIDPALERAADATETFVAEGATIAMNRFNSRERTDEPREDINPGWTGSGNENDN